MTERREGRNNGQGGSIERDRRRIAEETQAWVNSDQGRATVTKTLHDAHEAGKKLERARRLEQESLREPITN